jgi:antitoxin (DNA-binding transcriptional repressor) of toxin-antitoxin stability system
VAGCGGGGSEEVEQAEAAEVDSSSAVPKRLAAAESGAEDTIAAALSGDRSAVVADVASLREATGGSAKALASSGAPVAEVAELRRRTSRLVQVARTGSFVDVALAANAVSQLMPSLYRRFETRVPAEILTLDYLDREAQFRSLARQPAAVAVAVEQLGRTWAQVRTKVVAAGGAKEARDYQAHVARMERISPTAGRELQAEARRGLELVDQLESVFRQ